MYIQPAFLESDLPTLHEFIERHSFGVLISQHDGSPFATHLPFLLDRSSGTLGTLVGHVARANPQWVQCVGQQVLAVFTGPHAYISPTWYEAEHVVPTWNYVAVHSYGRLRLVEDQPKLLEMVRRSVEVYERSMPQPWSVDEADTFVERLLKQIVGFHIEIERIEGKWKLSQNHTVERREKVVRALRKRSDENSTAIAALMRQQLGEGVVPVKVVPATTPEQLRQVRRLFEEYAASLSFDLCFQNFQEELDGLPGDYAPPKGGLWVATSNREEALGCVALRRLGPGIGEMKRLYVRPECRGTGLGKRLTVKVLEEARSIGYQRIRLDTTPEMAGAIRLYESLGFTRISPYRPNPVEGALYMEIELGGASQFHLVHVTPELVELVAPLFDAYRQFYGQPPDPDGAQRFLAERLGRNQAVILAVVEDGRALGFTQLYPSFSSVSTRPIWILNDLFIADDARRRGVGARLLRAARDHALQTGAARLILSTAGTNTTAQSLYERDGWRRETAFLHYDYELPKDGW